MANDSNRAPPPERHTFTGTTARMYMATEADAPNVRRLAVVVMHRTHDQRLRVRRDVHRQIAARLGMPWGYYERMLRTAPNLLAENVNYWWHVQPEQRALTVEGDEWLVDWNLPAVEAAAVAG